MSSDSAPACAAQEILLEGDMTIANAQTIKARLTNALAQGGETVIRIGRIDDVDLTCLQLICAFHRSALARGLHVALDDHDSTEFKNFRKRVGFRRHQGCRFNPTHNCLWLKENANGENDPDCG
jgi:ABC-type transporter Mla MlaB component